MIVTYTGKYFDYNNIQKDSIDILDITHALPRISRFLGHCNRFYSVGEHTLIGLRMAIELGYTPLQQLHWLVHDFTEAYCGDCPSPLKKLLPEFQIIEAKVAVAIMAHLELEPLTCEELELVHRIDQTMLLIEMRDQTLHNHFNNMSELVYVEKLYDPSYNLVEGKMSAETITFKLRHYFEKLMKEVKADV